MKGKDYLLSIIVPAYNVEEFIGDCLDSIFDKNNLEGQVQLVIVNDGSTDNTLKVIEEKIHDSNDVTIISIENSGVSVARNTGFELSNGKYIWFIDPDDILEKDAIALILNKIVTHQKIDMFKFNYSTLKQIGNNWIATGKFGIYNNFEGKTINGYNCQKPFLLGLLEGAVWSNVIKRTLLLNNNFKAGIYYQDQPVCMNLLKNSKKILFMPDVLYQYRIREGSTTLSCNDNHIYSLFIATALVFDSLQNPKKLQHAFLVYYWHQLLANITKRQKNISSAQIEIFIQLLKPSLQHIQYSVNKNQRNTFIIRCQLELLDIFNKKLNNDKKIKEFCELVDLPLPESNDMKILEKKINSLTFKVINKCKVFIHNLLYYLL